MENNEESITTTVLDKIFYIGTWTFYIFYYADALTFAFLCILIHTSVKYIGTIIIENRWNVHFIQEHLSKVPLKQKKYLLFFST